MPDLSTSLPPALDRMVTRFQRVADPKQRYEQLISLAKKLPAFPEDQKIPENKVPGCVSQVYVIADCQDGKVSFQGDSDSQLVKGLVALLVQGLNGSTPEAILQITPDFIQATGLGVSLTPSRVNGFYNILKVMKQKTMAFCQNESGASNSDCVK